MGALLLGAWCSHMSQGVVAAEQVPEAPSSFLAGPTLVFLLAGRSWSPSSSKVPCGHAVSEPRARGRGCSAALGPFGQDQCIPVRLGQVPSVVPSTGAQLPSPGLGVPGELSVGPYSPKSKGKGGFSPSCSAKSPVRRQGADFWLLHPLLQ